MVYFVVGLIAGRLMTGNWMGGVAIRREPAGVGRVLPDRVRLARHVGGQFGDARARLSQLRDERRQPQSLAGGAWWLTAKAGTTTTTPISGPRLTAISGGNIDMTYAVIRLLEVAGPGEGRRAAAGLAQRVRHVLASANAATRG